MTEKSKDVKKDRLDNIELDIQKIFKILNGNGNDGIVTKIALINSCLNTIQEKKCENLSSCKLFYKNIEGTINKMEERIDSNEKKILLHNEMYKDIRSTMKQIFIAFVVTCITTISGIIIMVINALTGGN